MKRLVLFFGSVSLSFYRLVGWKLVVLCPPLRSAASVVVARGIFLFVRRRSISGFSRRVTVFFVRRSISRLVVL